MKDFVSIIIPTYQRPEKLKIAIESVLKQSYNSFEILVINDSNEEVQVIELIEKLEDQRIRYFRNLRTKGANGARNTGIINSKGNFIAFLDDDDEWLPGKLESQLNCINSKQLEFGAVYSAYQIESNNNWNNYYGIKEGKIINEILLDKVKICTGSNLLVKAEVFEKTGLWDEELLRQQDLEFLIRLLNHYQLAYDNNIVAKIYGHNTPNPKKAFEEREKYILKISDFLLLLSDDEINQFYSDHYRRQVVYLLKLKNFKLANEYWKKSRKYKMFVVRKDIKMLLFYLKNKVN